jgi:hypothetical protein
MHNLLNDRLQTLPTPYFSEVNGELVGPPSSTWDTMAPGVAKYCTSRMATVNGGTDLRTMRCAAIELNWLVDASQTRHQDVRGSYDPWTVAVIAGDLPADRELTLEEQLVIGRLDVATFRQIPRSVRVQATMRTPMFEGQQGYGCYIVTENLTAEGQRAIRNILVDAQQLQQIIEAGQFPQFASFFREGYIGVFAAPAGVTLIAQSTVTDRCSGEKLNLSGFRFFLPYDLYGILHPVQTVCYVQGLQRLGHLPENLREVDFVRAIMDLTARRWLPLCRRLHLVYDTGDKGLLGQIRSILGSYATYSAHMDQVLPLPGEEPVAAAVPAEVDAF